MTERCPVSASVGLKRGARGHFVRRPVRGNNSAKSGIGVLSDVEANEGRGQAHGAGDSFTLDPVGWIERIRCLG